MNGKISFTMHLFKEGEMFVAYVPELDLSSCGDTVEVARRNIRDAVRGFLEASEERGTLPEILEEAGYQRQGEEWEPPEFISLESVTVSLHS